MNEFAVIFIILLVERNRKFAKVYPNTHHRITTIKQGRGLWYPKLTQKQYSQRLIQLIKASMNTQ